MTDTPAPEARIIVVEDDARLAAQLDALLTRAGFAVTVIGDGLSAAERIPAEAPDLVLLDVELPGQDGFAVCRAVRPRYAGLIAMLTARRDEIDEVVGLELGADDYIPKPIRARALVSRLKALLRRAGPARSSPTLDVGPLSIDPGRREVRLNGAPIELTDAEFDLLVVLARGAGEVLDRDRIYRALRGVPYDGLDRSIDLRVSRLRRKLGDDPPRLIKAVRGVGYLMVAP